MKKICFFSASYLPSIGGIERYTYHLSCELIKNGFEVSVVTSNLEGLDNFEVSDEGIKIYRFNCYHFLNGRYPIYKKDSTFFSIKNKLINENFDFIVVNARFYIHSLFGVKFAHTNNIPCITIEHGSSHLSVNNIILDKLGAVYEHFLTHFIKKYCHDFYGVSKAACDWSAHFGIKSKGVLYNAVDLNKINTLLESPITSYKSENNLPANATVITYTGRLVKEKGALQLAKAVDKIDKNLFLFIAGDGELYEEIKNISNHNPRIILLGKIDFNHIIALLKESDIFCLPTVYPEGLPTSVLEAAATKNYIITTTVGGAKEIIADNSYGTLISDNNPDTILNAIIMYFDNKLGCEAAINKTYDTLLNKFTWETTTKELIKIISY